MPGTADIPFYMENSWPRPTENRGADCLSYLVEHHSPSNPTVLEIGPVDRIQLERNSIREAPIALFKAQKPNIKCAAIGPEDLTKNQQKELLGEAQWIPGMYGEGSADFLQSTRDRITNVFSGKPSIIYASHVIEDSKGAPFSRYRIFEEAASQLPDDGLLVIDNAWGQYSLVARKPWPASERMRLHSIFHTDTRSVKDYWSPREQITYLKSIFVFQRAPVHMTTESIDQETRQAKKGLVTRSIIEN